MEEKTVSKYDRLRGGLEGIALFTKQSTIANVETLTGKAETFVIETARLSGGMGKANEEGDYIFVQCIDENALTTRLCLPPRVANVIASQRESLTKRRRRAVSKAAATERMKRGIMPGFVHKPYRRTKKAKAA